MRMWKLPVSLLCNKHLLGEHVEMHMFVGVINKNTSLTGYLEKGLVEIDQIKSRHNILAKELIARGMNHNSPLQPFTYSGPNGHVNILHNLQDLVSRCPQCRTRFILQLKGPELPLQKLSI